MKKVGQLRNFGIGFRGASRGCGEDYVKVPAIVHYLLYTSSMESCEILPRAFFLTIIVLAVKLTLTARGIWSIFFKIKH